MKYVNEEQIQFFMNHLDECDRDKEYMDEFEGFFSLIKLRNFMYILFPKLNLELIQNKELLQLQN